MRWWKTMVAVIFLACWAGLTPARATIVSTVIDQQVLLVATTGSSHGDISGLEAGRALRVHHINPRLSLPYPSLPAGEAAPLRFSTFFRRSAVSGLAPDLSRTWQFTFRTALHPRAP